MRRLLVLFVLTCGCEPKGSSSGYLDSPKELPAEDAPRVVVGTTVQALVAAPGAGVQGPEAKNAVATSNAATPTATDAHEPTDGPDLVPPACAEATPARLPAGGSYYICDIAQGPFDDLREWHCIVSEAEPKLRIHGAAYAFAEIAGGKLRVVANADRNLGYRTSERVQTTVDFGANTPRLWARRRGGDVDASIECRFTGG